LNALTGAGVRTTKATRTHTMTAQRRRVMSKCVGIEGKFCGLEFDSGLEFPDDTLCDECFDEMAEEVA